MGQKILIDTNVIIDSLANKLSGKAKQILVENEFIISAVTKIETLGWKDAPVKDLETLYGLMEIAAIIQIDNEIIDRAIYVRQRKRIKLGDSIIAATALVYGLTVYTRNISDFKGIDGLSILNPYDL